MLFELHSGDDDMSVGRQYAKRAPHEMGIREKAIEEWIASDPQLLFPDEEVLVIGQSVAGKSMADVLALDSVGNLIVVEIKRGKSDRSTIGQLLEYVARLDEVGYERLNEIAQNYNKWDGAELHDAFSGFTDREDVARDEIGSDKRTVIVAPESDQELERIIRWLRKFNVPIELVPFSVFADEDGTPRLVMIDGVASSAEIQGAEEEWAGHWFFNTNESHGPGAYKRMFERDVAAIYGYDSGPQRLEGASEGDTVLAYVNEQGLRAIGEVQSGDVEPGEGIFIDDAGNQQPNEYHLEVDWSVILPENKALSSSEAAERGYHLPVRTSFGRLKKGRLASRLERAMRQRAE